MSAAQFTGMHANIDAACHYLNTCSATSSLIILTMGRILAKKHLIICIKLLGLKPYATKLIQQFTDNI